MLNNYVLRSVRYMLDLSDAKWPKSPDLPD